MNDVFIFRFIIIITLILLSTFTVVTCAIPLSPHIAVLGVLMFAHGLCLGALDNGIFMSHDLYM